MPEIKPIPEPTPTPNINFSQLRQAFQNVGFKILKRILQSYNFVTGVYGWRLTADGDFEGNSGVFRGTVSAGALNIPDSTTASSFHVDASGNTWWGANVASGIANALASIYATGSAVFSSITITNPSTSFIQVPISIATIAGESLSANDAVYLAPSTTYTAIAFDAASGGVAVGAATLTYSHTCTGSNRILFVSAFSNLNTGNSVSSVTYNSVPLTKIDTVTQNNQEATLWYLIDPATGANNVVVTQGNAGGSIRSNSSSYVNARQPGGQPDNSATNSNSSSASITGTVTTVNDNCWTIMLAQSDGGSLTAGTGSTSRNIQGGAYGIFDSNGVKTPAGSTSMTVTTTAGRNDIIIASFRPIPTEVSKVYKTTAFTTRQSDAFIGFASTSVAIDANINVIIQGLVSGFSSLAIGTKYYLSDTFGALSTSVGTNTRKATMAASETEHLITNIW